MPDYNIQKFGNCQPSPPPGLPSRASISQSSEVLEAPALFGSEGLQPIVLNNGAGDAPPPLGKLPFRHGPLSPRKIEIVDAIRSRSDSEGLRGILESSLALKYPGVKWSASHWAFIDLYKRMAKKVFDIRRGKYSEDGRFYLYFDICYSPRSKGKVYFGDDGVVYSKRHHCGEGPCLLCDSLERKSLAREHLKVRKQVVAKHPEGFKGFLNLTFTLPEEVEGLPFQNPEIERKLLNAQQRFIRELFGLKTRANISFNYAVHPVAGDLLRDRWHVDVNIIPGIVEKGKFRWVEPVKVDEEKGHCSEEWKVNLEWAKVRWSELASEAIGRPLSAIQPQVEFIPFSPDARYWKDSKNRLKKGQSFDDVFWGKVNHRSRYSLRSFSKDYEDSVLRTDREGNYFIVKATYGEWHLWYNVHARFFVERTKEIHERNRINSRGWFQCLHRYRDLLGILEEEPTPPPEVRGPVRARVEMIREKRYDPTLSKIVWFRDELYSFKCPITDEKKKLSVKNMQPWVWPDLPWPEITPASVSNPDPDSSPQRNLPGISRAPPAWWKEREYVQ